MIPPPLYGRRLAASTSVPMSGFARLAFGSHIRFLCLLAHEVGHPLNVEKTAPAATQEGASGVVGAGVAVANVGSS